MHFDVASESFLLDVTASSDGIQKNADFVLSCPTQITKTALVELAPVQRSLNYFEVKIAHLDVLGAVGIGVGRKGYPLDQMPGFRPLSVGYHSEEGKLHHGSSKGQAFGPVCEIGDVMGCGVDFEGMDDDRIVTVWFSKNGELAGAPTRTALPKTGFCPLIGILTPKDAVKYLGHSHKVAPYHERPIFQPPLQIPDEPEDVFEVIYPFDSTDASELSMQPGDIVKVKDWGHSRYWAMGKIKGKSGLFYKAFVKSQTKGGTHTVNRGPIPTKPPEGHRVTYQNIDFLIVEKPEEWLECIICQQLANAPRQTACCGHTLCLDCAEKWRSRNNSCPQCRQRPFNFILDPRTDRSIKGLTAYCKNVMQGCRWKGSVSAIHQHIRGECLLQPVACPNQCGKRIPRIDVETHIATTCKYARVLCPCCSRYINVRGAEKVVLRGRMKYTELMHSHYKVCREWPARCPNKCGSDEHFTRTSVEEHVRNECPEGVVECSWCEGVKVKRREEEQHLVASMSTHFTAMLKDYSNVKQLLKKVVEENKRLKERLVEIEDKIQTNL